MFLSARSVIAACVAMLLVAGLARADPRADDIDTEHLFGFTEGSDIGAPPERELESETTARVGRRSGQYRALASALVAKLPLSDRFRVAPGLGFARYAIAGVPGFADRDMAEVGGGFVETRARLLRRDEAPFGLTLNTVFGANRIDAATGFGARGFTSEAGLLLDREIVPGRLVAAVNLVYAFGRSRLDGLPNLQQASGLQMSGALAQRITPGFFLGAEARYLRGYSGLGLDRLAGEAVYLGPTLYKEFAHGTWISLTWGVQVAGDAVETPDSLDLTNFDRHQARLRLGTHF